MSLISKAKNSAIWVTGGQIFFKIFSLASLIILNRLLTPEEFGVVAIANVALAIIRLIGNLGITAGIIQRAENLDNYLNSAFWINFALGLSLTVLTLIFSPLISYIYEIEELKLILIYLAFGFILKSFETVPVSILSKELDFKSITIIDISSEIISTIIVVILAFLGFGVWSLIIPMVAISPVKSIFLWMKCKWRPNFKIDFKLCKEVYDFGKHSFISEFVGYLLSNIDYLIIGKFLGQGAVGIYQFAYNWANWPTTNVVWLLGRVAFPTFSKLQNDLDEMRRVYNKMTKFVSVFSVIFYVIILIDTESFVRIIGGEQWLEAIIPLKIISIYGLIRSLGSHGGKVFLAIGKPEILSKYGLITFPIIVLGLFIGVQFGIVGVSIATAINSGISGLVFIWLVYTKMNSHFFEFLKMISPAFTSGLIAASVLTLINYFIAGIELNFIVKFGITSIIGLAVFVASFRLLFTTSFKEIKEVVVRK